MAPDVDDSSDYVKELERRRQDATDMDGFFSQNPMLKTAYDQVKQAGSSPSPTRVKEIQEQLLKTMSPAQMNELEEKMRSTMGSNGSIADTMQRTLKPNVDARLFGQKLSCWHCSNVLLKDGEVHRCSRCSVATYCSKAHRDMHAELHNAECAVLRDEGDPGEINVVACMVLPVDEEVKPFVRHLPRNGPLAVKKLQALLSLAKIKGAAVSTPLLQCTPYRGFMPSPPYQTEFDPNLQNGQIFFIQSDFGAPFEEAPVIIENLTSASGKVLNGLEGSLTGRYYPGLGAKSTDRWEVRVGTEVKLLQGANIRLKKLKAKAAARQNFRASCILTPLDFKKFGNAFYTDDGKIDLAVRARGDVWAIRSSQPLFLADGAPNPNAQLEPFGKELYDKLWGIFQMMPKLGGMPSRLAMGTVTSNDAQGLQNIERMNSLLMQVASGA